MLPSAKINSDAVNNVIIEPTNAIHLTEMQVWKRELRLASKALVHAERVALMSFLL